MIKSVVFIPSVSNTEINNFTNNNLTLVLKIKNIQIQLNN